MSKDKMTVAEALQIATMEDAVPGAHEQATASYVLAGEIQRLRSVKMTQTATKRITVYQVPEGKVRFVLACENGQPIMSDRPITSGLYICDPLYNPQDIELIYLRLVDDELTFSRHVVRVEDVVEFRRQFVPENPDGQ